MSQKKVDAYKDYKKNKDKILKKEKAKSHRDGSQHDGLY